MKGEKTMQENLSHDAILREVLRDLEAVTARVRQLTTPQAKPRPKGLKIEFKPDGGLVIRSSNKGDEHE
jgi:hypothetical protein